VRRWRRLAEAAQALAVLGLPFLRVDGESALRLDVPSLTLHAFGARVGLDELLVVLAATLFALFAFLLVTVLFGRLWCGWACPQTALLDLTGFLDRARKKGGWRLAAAWGAAALASALVSANLLWYFVEPAEFFRRVAAFSPGPVLGPAWLVTGLVVFLDLGFWRHRFCATTCPYAKLQGALFDSHSMVIAYDSRRAADCIDCEACVRVCPVGIDIRDGLQAACVSCGECIDACTPIMTKLRRPTKLVGYFFGAPGTPRRLVRPAAVALSVLTAGSFAFTVAVGAERSPLEVTVTASGDFAPRRTASGEVWNGYTVALENRGREPLALTLALSAAGAAVAVKPDAVLLAPGQHQRLRVVASARGLAAGARDLPGELSVRAAGAGGPAAARAVTFTVPGVPASAVAAPAPAAVVAP
jgi:cytochrome c oxidase accessory protein FixG